MFLDALPAIIVWTVARCATCRAKNETIRALKDALAAQKQAMLVLADQVDALRGVQPASSMPYSQFAPERTEGKMWVDDEEEELIALVEQGILSVPQFEEQLAALQAQNQTLKVVK